MNPWGLGRTFGGEAESRFVTMNPDACQVLDDGRRVAAACLNHPRYRAFCAEWADAALEAGADLVFWDEPHWVVPEHVGVDDPTRWSCTVRRLSRALRPRLPGGPRRRGARLPRGVARRLPRRAHRARACARRPQHGLPAPRGRGRARRARLGRRRRRFRASTSSRPIPTGRASTRRPARSFAASRSSSSRRRPATVSPRSSGCPRSASRAADIPDLEDAVSAARAAGVERVWVWGYEACAHMSHLATPDSLEVWERACRAARRADGADHRGRARRPRRPRPALVRRARLADERAGRDRPVGRRSRR